MPKKRFSNAFLAAQVVGSCRLENIPVSPLQEQQVLAIIEGNLDPAALSEALVKQFTQPASDLPKTTTPAAPLA